MSVGSIPSFRDIKKELGKHKRANSYYLYKGHNTAGVAGTIDTNEMRPQPLDKSVPGADNLSQRSDGANEMDTQLQQPVDEFSDANAWARSYKRMKRMIAASEDNEPGDVSQDSNYSDFPGLKKNHEREKAKLQKKVLSLRKRAVRKSPKYKPKYNLIHSEAPEIV